ncbi:hypothetical protein EMMF5_000618 [Cystobasidiomycetes sp. EMM_F5]
MAMFASAADRRALHVPNGKGGATRPPIKRTASTADISADDDLNTVAFIDQHRVINAGDISSDDEGHFGVGKLGVREDWESDSEDDSSEVEMDVSGRPQRTARRRVGKQDDDPFMLTNSAATTTPTTSSPTEPASRMLVDGSPPSSPTYAAAGRQQAQQRGVKRKLPASTEGSADTGYKMSEKARKQFDDEESNPFLVRPQTSAAGSAKSDGPRKTQDGNHKMSYVFRGKRITYEADISSLHPDLDSDEEELNRKLGVKSGPRVLFPAPPTPVASTSKRTTANVSPPCATSAAANAHLMQTPRRPGKKGVVSFVESSPVDTRFPAATPATTSRARSSAVELDVSRAGSQKRKVEQDDGLSRGIPPTPASLPQPRLSEMDKHVINPEQAQSMRESFINTMNAMHQSSVNQHRRRMSGMMSNPASDAARLARRHAPYHPR